MKLFDFECIECKHQFEKLIRTDSEAPKCPECDSETRQMTCFETGSAPSSRVQWVYMDSQLQKPFSTKRGLLNSMARRRDAMHRD